MEFYKPTRKDLKESIRAAKKVSAITGSSFLFHWIDSLYCVIRYGCSPLQYYEGGFFKLRSFDRNEAYTKRRIGKVVARYNDMRYKSLLNNKVEFYKHFADFIRRDWIDCKTASTSEIENFLKRTGHCLIKPAGGSKGKGIQKLQQEDVKTISQYVGKDYIFEEIIDQHPMMCFNNKSVNTLRMMTIMDSLGEVHLIKVALRCGTGDSIVDNFCAGGVIYPVDLHYGRINGPGLTNSLGQQVFVHPGSEIYMLGREIPFWQQAVECVKEVAKRIPQMRFVGWDIAITNEGPVLIEGNQGPGVIFDSLNMKHGLYKEMMSYK